MAEIKSRILYILKYLWHNTDAEHYATTGDILTYLKENGISCDRKTIPGDIAKLCDIGIDIEEERSRENRYSLSSHLFTLPEVKLLMDAVESSKFIMAKKSSELVNKLSQMTSVYQSEELKRNINISERVKPMNEQIYYLVDNTNTAINQGKQISFLYYHYNQYREEVPNNDGKRYHFSTYYLVWNEDHYYTINILVIKITNEMLRKYLVEYQTINNCGKVTIDNIRRSLSTFFSWLEEEDYIIKSPMKRIHKVKTAVIVKDTIPDEKIEILRDNCNNLRDRAMIDFLLSTGIRVGELGRQKFIC